MRSQSFGADGIQGVVTKGFATIHTRATHGMNSALHCDHRFV